MASGTPEPLLLPTFRTSATTGTTGTTTTVKKNVRKGALPWSRSINKQLVVDRMTAAGRCVMHC